MASRGRARRWDQRQSHRLSRRRLEQRQAASAAWSEHAPQIPVKEKTVTLAREARLVAGRFILTAVARRHLAESYDLVGPQLKQGLTRAQWATGSIPVVPFPVNLLQFAPMKVDFSYRDHAMVEVALLPKDGAKVDGAAVKPQLFYLELQAYGKGKARHWLVTSWVPRASPRVPLPAN